MKTFDLKSFRKSIAHLTQEEFAKKIGLATGTIGKIEAGHQKISDNILDKIEEVFGVDLSQYKSYNKNIVKEPEAAYGENWQARYFELMEKHNALLEKYAKLLEDKEAVAEGQKSKVTIHNKPIH